MRKRIKGDFAQNALHVVEIATGAPLKSKKNPAAVALGKMGGKKSRAGRMEKITPERRREIASKAARERWDKERAKQ